MLLPRMVVGLATPRSGTWSLFRLLEAQPDTHAFHEGGYLPWETDLTEMWRQVYRFQGVALSKKFDMKIIASVAFFWAPYVSEMMSMLVNPRFICLQRDKMEWVHSMQNHFSRENFLTDPESEHWDDRYITNKDACLFPTYDLPRFEAFLQYYEDFYALAEFWQDKCPDVFRIFPLESLNTEDGVKSILDFAGYKDNKVIHVGVKLNTKEKTRGKIDV